MGFLVNGEKAKHQTSFRMASFPGELDNFLSIAAQGVTKNEIISVSADASAETNRSSD